MNLKIEIDAGSGFCFGVTTAIRKAEEELAAGKTLYCLGDIVHNGMEVERLHNQGLVTIDHTNSSNNSTTPKCCSVPTVSHPPPTRLRGKTTLRSSMPHAP